MYALNLDNEGRILSATFPEYAPADAVIVETLPEGNINDYLYINGGYEYAPVPVEPTPEPEQPIDYEARIAALEEELAAAKILLGVT